jgi:glycosyltransferase involved in cell wall biosynthesis
MRKYPMNKKKKNPLVSIIIRTKNEEKWISSCLRAIETQIYKN